MVKKYKKKPIVVEAIQWLGNNQHEVLKFIENKGWFSLASGIIIKTPTGQLVADTSDYIIKGTQGEFYPCKPHIFKDLYEEVK